MWKGSGLDHAANAIELLYCTACMMCIDEKYCKRSIEKEEARQPNLVEVHVNGYNLTLLLESMTDSTVVLNTKPC